MYPPVSTVKSRVGCYDLENEIFPFPSAQLLNSPMWHVCNWLVDSVLMLDSAE